MKDYRKIIRYYNIHGHTKTLEHFKIWPVTIATAKRKLEGNGYYAGDPKQPAPERTGRSLYLAAKALERALMEHRRAGNPSSDIEHYAFFLLKEILK